MFAGCVRRASPVKTSSIKYYIGNRLHGGFNRREADGERWLGLRLSRSSQKIAGVSSARGRERSAVPWNCSSILGDHCRTTGRIVTRMISGKDGNVTRFDPARPLTLYATYNVPRQGKPTREPA